MSTVLLPATVGVADPARAHRLRQLYLECAVVEADIQHCTHVLTHSSDLSAAEAAERDLDVLTIRRREVWEHIYETATGH